MVKDMTIGGPLKLISTFTIPFLIGNIIQQFYVIISSIFVSVFVGTNALGGVGIASTISFMVFGFAVGSCNGFCIVLAQRFGAKRKKGIKISVAASLHLYILFTILVTIISVIITKPLLLFMDTPQANYEHAYTFAIISYCGIFSQVAYNLFSGMLRSVGDNKTPLIFLIISAILNVLFDFITVAVLHLGTKGAAISTIAAQTISSIPCLIFIYKKYPFMWPTKKEWKINKRYILAQIKIGIPMGLEFAITAIGIIMLQKTINKFGENIIAGFAIAMRVENLVIASFIALSIATATYTAQNFGAQKYIRIKQGAKSTIIIGMFFCAFFSSILMLLWDQITELYLLTSDPATTQATKIAIKKAARQYINIAIYNYPVLCLLITFRSLVQALGRTLIPLLAGVCELVMRVLGAVVLAHLFGYVGICCSPILAWYGAFFMVIGAYIFNIRKLLKSSSKKNI